MPITRPLIFAFVLATPLLMIGLWGTSVIAALAIFAAAHAAILPPLFMPGLGWLGPVVTRFRPAAGERAVWLTIDDGPDPGDSAEILDLLDRHGARATFFLKGELAARHPELVRAMVERGHQVANHSHTHPTAFFWCAPPAQVEREVRRCNEAIAAATGGPAPALFRAPVGIKSPALHPVLGRLGMRLCAWSIRAYDGVRGFEPARVAARVLGQLHPGAIICMHQGIRDPDDRPLSPRGLAAVLEGLGERGYTCRIPAADELT
ncbi:MAG: polysaccharide deacetylase family protein [Myxococcales bacterium]|nr:polysaccharide deacetylase family protein [Myxococcales bacterium]MCB9567359.1 polysaccharide deacetylase family protein [Myxococcales bacterium]MCB9700764.1 polysaccharide deacetylase family protein [Myxococcales bacterium]